MGHYDFPTPGGGGGGSQLESRVAMARFYIQYLPVAVGGSSARMSGLGRSGDAPASRQICVKRRRLSTAFSLSLRIHIHQPLVLYLRLQCARIDCAATRRLFPYPSQPLSPRHPSFLSLSFRSQAALFSLSPWMATCASFTRILMSSYLR